MNEGVQKQAATTDYYCSRYLLLFQDSLPNGGFLPFSPWKHQITWGGCFNARHSLKFVGHTAVVLLVVWVLLCAQWEAAWHNQQGWEYGTDIASETEIFQNGCWFPHVSYLAMSFDCFHQIFLLYEWIVNDGEEPVCVIRDQIHTTGENIDAWMNDFKLGFLVNKP